MQQIRYDLSFQDLDKVFTDPYMPTNQIFAASYRCQHCLAGITGICCSYSDSLKNPVDLPTEWNYLKISNPFYNFG